MALAHWQKTFTDTAGNIQAGIEVTIRNESTGAVAAIYSDSAGTTAKANPFTTDSFGYGDFYAADGRYRIQATGIDWRNEELLTFENLAAAVTDAQEARDAAAVNGNIYTDTTAGLAATVDGEYFSTPAAASDDYLTLYRNDAGVATEIDTYPNSTAIDNVFTELDKRTIYVGSVAELEALASPEEGQEAIVYGVPFIYKSAQWLPSAGFVTPFCYGAIGDGVADDSTAFSDTFAVAEGLTVLVPKGTYRIGQNDLPSDCTVLIDSGVTLNLITAPANFTHFYVYQKNNIKILGKGAVLSMTKTDYTGESNHGVNIDASTNVEVEGLYVKDTGGDGIYIGGGSSSTACDNVIIKKCIVDNCRRNGLSVTFGKNIIIDTCLFKNMSGALPEAGLDLEPNIGTTVDNVQVKNCFSVDNRDGFLAVFGANRSSFEGCYAVNSTNTGFNISSSSSAPAERIPSDITLNSCYAYNSSSSGFYVFYANGVKVNSSYSVGNSGFGIQLQSSPECSVSDCSFLENTGRGVALIDIAEISLTNNKIRYNRGGGLVMSGTNTDCTIDGNTLVGNYDLSGTFNSNVRLLATRGVFSNNIGKEGIGANKPAIGLDINSSCSDILEFGNDFVGSGTSEDISSYVAGNFKAFSTLSFVRSGNGANNKGGFEVPFTASQAASRTWQIKNDNFEFGDLAVLQATTQGGSTYDAFLRISASGNVSSGADNDKNIGTSSLRWANTYSTNFRPGTGAVIWTSGSGSPEGAVTAPVGSVFTRTDGGAGTTLYVKESGASNTGWVAK